ncbi:MAG: BamA/TamA family outer membrane protein [Polyangiales bacterium]
MSSAAVLRGSISLDGIDGVLSEIEALGSTGVLCYSDGVRSGEIDIIGGLISDRPPMPSERDGDPLEEFLSLRSGEFAFYPKLPKLPVSRGNDYSKRGTLRVHEPISLMRYCEKAALTGRLLLERHGQIAIANYDRGRLVNTTLDDGPADNFQQCLRWDDGTFRIDTTAVSVHPNGMRLRVVDEVEKKQDSTGVQLLRAIESGLASLKRAQHSDDFLSDDSVYPVGVEPVVSEVMPSWVDDDEVTQKVFRHPEHQLPFYGSEIGQPGHFLRYSPSARRVQSVTTDAVNNTSDKQGSFLSTLGWVGVIAVIVLGSLAILSASTAQLSMRRSGVCARGVFIAMVCVALGCPLSAQAQPVDGTNPVEIDDTDVIGDDTSGADSSATFDEYDSTIASDNHVPSTQDAYGSFTASDDESSGTARVRYVLEAITVKGNTRTKSSIVRSFVPIQIGEIFDAESEEIEAIEWRLMGTGWFRRVRIELERGEGRGQVVMVVHVKERPTVVLEQVAVGISEGVASSTDHHVDVSPYLGATVTETNFLGRGMRLSGSFLVSHRQQGVRVELSHPKLFANKYSLDTAAFFNNAREFFGHDPLVSVRCDELECRDVFEATDAVVRYRRGGWLVGTGRDFGRNGRYAIAWQGEVASVLGRPEAASEQRGDDIRPIDFAIADGKSFLSSLRIDLTFDKRDDPGFTQRGALFRVGILGSSRALGSSYDFLRVQSTFFRWWRVGKGSTLRLGGFAGVIFGSSPFFYQFHVSDLTDLIPSRILETQLDRRPPPNLLRTAIEVMRTEELAFRGDIQYELPVIRRGSDRGLRRMNAYFNLGLYGLSDLREARLGISGYQGASKIPVDLTFDIGFIFDTKIGVLKIGFSNLVGFIPW